jgi:zinc protease
MASALDPYSTVRIAAISNPANVTKVDAAVRDEVNKFVNDGLSAAELADGKKALLDQLKLLRTADNRLASMLAQNLNAGRTFDYHADLEKRLAELTPEQVRDAYRKHLAVGKLIFVHAGDLK